MAYPVTVDPLHTVFSPYGAVQKMAIFEKNNQWQVCGRLPRMVRAVRVDLPSSGHDHCPNVAPCIALSMLAGAGTVLKCSRGSQCQGVIRGACHL